MISALLYYSMNSWKIIKCLLYGREERHYIGEGILLLMYSLVTASTVCACISQKNIDSCFINPLSIVYGT